MERKWVFPDPVFGPTIFSGKELELIKTAELTRLRDIMQLSTAYIFYPAATHSRFEHSLGMARLVRDFVINALGERSVRMVSLLVYASLVHDIGHGGWSHAGELFMKYRGIPLEHDDLSSRLVEGDPNLTKYFTHYGLPLVSDVLRQDDRDAVSKLVRGRAPIFAGEKSAEEVEKEEKEKRYLGQLIASRALDFDRLEYLIRDAFYTATSASFFKLKDVFENLGKDKVLEANELVFGNRDFAESFVLTRELMYSGLYQATENLVSKEMLARAFNLCFDVSVDPYEIWFKTDDELLRDMYDNDESRYIARMIKNGQIYDILYENSFDRLPTRAIDKLKGLTKPQILEVEEQLAKPELNPCKVLVCISVSQDPKERDSWVKVADGHEPLWRVSPLVNGMTENYRDSRCRVVFAIDPVVTESDKQKALNRFRSYFTIS